MPAISLVSAADLNLADDLPPGTFADTRRASQAALLHEAAGAVFERGWAEAAIRLRRTGLYRRTLMGAVADQIDFYTEDYRPWSLQDADALMRGRFRFAGDSLHVKDGSVFDQPAPSAEFAAALHGFDWLRHLEAAGGDLARESALKLTQQWLNRYGRYSMPGWRPEVIAERLLNLFAHGAFFIGDLDPAWRMKFFTSLRDQAVMLGRSLHESPDGLSHFKSATALVLAGLCLRNERVAASGMKHLSREIERQILPDGGHVSRSPAQLLDMIRLLSMVKQALAHSGRSEPGLDDVLDRLLLLLRFFRLGDGALAVFNGGGEDDARAIHQLLAADQRQDQRLTHLPESGFHRLTLGRAVVLFDGGAPPGGAISVTAHAGCLSFEMSSGAHRLVVNCGGSAARDESWRRALRSTPAHSTLTLNGRSQSPLLRKGVLGNLLGARLAGGPMQVVARRLESAHGLSVEASHDAYVAEFGLVHERRMTLSRGGLTLTGADRLIPVSAQPDPRRGIPFAIRFHIHPDVRLSLAQGGSSVILKLPNREGWRFRCGGGELAVEESIYFGSGPARRAEQLVIKGTAKAETIEAAWVFEHVGSN